MKSLLVFSCSGTVLGVWEEEVSSIRDGLVLHRLPLSPPAIAGMSVLNDRTVTFADLAACVGLPAMTRDQDVHCLVIGEQEKIAGFAVEGEIRRLSVSPDAVIPLPEYLGTSAMTSCVAHAGRPVPVIDITSLYGRVKDGRLEPPTPGLAVTGFNRAESSSPDDLRVITVAEETFAVPAGGIEKEAVPRGPITKLPLLPEFLAGVTLYRGKAVPAIYPARRMALLKAGTGDRMVAAHVGDGTYGFLVDDAFQPAPPRDAEIKPLPPLAVCGWMESAAAGKDAILPVVDLAALIAGSESELSRVPLPERYAPDSPFADLFLKEDADVREFLLLGARHALPRGEVRDTIPLKPWRPLPNVQPIVVGIARHEDRLLPVLDLAMIFGRRSIISPQWKMMLVRNGDFEALVLTEAVFRERRIPLENQRAVPIVLPHRVVYGCYPDAGTVKLVLNVEALTVYFDKSLVKGFIGAISKEMAEAPAEIVPALLPEETVPLEAAPEAAGAGITPEDLLIATQAEQDLTAAEAGFARAEEELLREAMEEEREEAELEEQTAALAAPGPPAESAETELRPAKEEIVAGAAAGAGEEETILQETAEADLARAEAERARQAEEERIAAEERSRAEADERARAEEEERARRDEEERARIAQEERMRAEEAMRAQEASEAARREEELRRHEAAAAAEARARADALREAEEKARLEKERALREAEEQARREAEEQARREAEERSMAEAAEQSRKEEEARRAAEERARVEAAEQARREAEERARREAEERQRKEAEERERIAAETRAREEAERQAREEAAAAVREAEEIARREAAAAERERSAAYREVTGPVLDLVRDKEPQGGRKPASGKRILAGVLGVILIGALLFFAVSRRPQEPAISEGPVVAEEKKSQPSQAAPARPPEQKPEPEEPLVLTVPKDAPLDVEVYVVKKGDTLWAISKRFTGNPFNYPRVAKDNKIANPDLIFPKQKIRIKREE